MEVQGVDSQKNDRFPYSGIRVLGSVQAGIGTLCVLLGSLDLALTLIPRDYERQLYSSNATEKTVYGTIVTLTIASCPLWCGMWFIISGSIGTCVSRMRSHSLIFFRNTFLTLSVLCAALFGPACLVISSYEAFLAYERRSAKIVWKLVTTRHGLDGSDFRWLMPLLVAFLSLLEVVLAVGSAAMCCCCSSVQLTKVHVLFAAPPNGARPQEVYRMEAATSRRPSPRMIQGQERLRALPSPEPEPEPEVEPEVTPRKEMTFWRSAPVDNYGKLKKWALPTEY